MQRRKRTILRRVTGGNRREPTDKIVIMGDLNARVGNEALTGITQRFNEEEVNENGELLKSLCAANTLRINNTFFEHDMKYKYTWQNTRGQQSVIDYFITNRAITPQMILDIRTLNAANVGSDHKLVLCKLRLSLPSKPKPKPQYVHKFNIESLEDQSTQQLYCKRLTEKIEQNPIIEINHVDHQWETLKDNILSAARESIGERKVDINRENKTPWFTPEIKELANQKKNAYINHIRDRNRENWTLYTQVRNRVNAKIRSIKEDYWEGFTKGMERDLYGSQRKIWGMLRRNKLEIKDTVETNKISMTEWEEYFRTAYSGEENLLQAKDNEETDEINIETEAIENIPVPTE